MFSRGRRILASFSLILTFTGESTHESHYHSVCTGRVRLRRASDGVYGTGPEQRQKGNDGEATAHRQNSGYLQKDNPPCRFVLHRWKLLPAMPDLLQEQHLQHGQVSERMLQHRRLQTRSSLLRIDRKIAGWGEILPILPYRTLTTRLLFDFSSARLSMGPSIGAGPSLVRMRTKTAFPALNCTSSTQSPTPNSGGILIRQ